MLGWPRAMVARAARPPGVSFRVRAACASGQVEVGLGEQARVVGCPESCFSDRFLKSGSHRSPRGRGGGFVAGPRGWRLPRVGSPGWDDR